MTYQEYECAVCLVIVSLRNRTAEGRIRQNSTVVCNKRDRAIICAFCQDLHLTLMFSCLVQKGLFKGMQSLAESFFNWGEIIITLFLLRKFTNVRKWSLCFSKIAFVICASPIIHLVCPPKILHNVSFFISPGYYSHSKRNWRQCVYKMFEGQTRCNTGDVQMANGTYNSSVCEV